MALLWEAAQSSNILKVGYDEETGEMQVMFTPVRSISTTASRRMSTRTSRSFASVVAA